MYHTNFSYYSYYSIIYSPLVPKRARISEFQVLESVRNKNDSKYILQISILGIETKKKQADFSNLL